MRLARCARRGGEAEGQTHHAAGLGRLLQRLGDYTGAEVALRRALEIRETLGPEHLLVAKSLYNLGRLLQDRGEQGAASDLLKRSFNIRLARFST